MTTYQDLKDFFKSQDFKLIIAADAETRINRKAGEGTVSETPAGGVAVAFDPIAQASGALYVARGKTEEDKKLLLGKNKYKVTAEKGEYTLKRLFIGPQDMDLYYNGFSNQTLWPLCHVAFQRPEFHKNWYDGFKKVNQKFAQTIKEEIKGNTFVWVNDYQLSLVPSFLERPKNTTLAMFWHIPWPTWEVFRILPFKKEILESLLRCDFLAFHRGYHVRNFFDTLRREFEVRIDEETNTVYFDGHTTKVLNLPLGVDSDVIKSLVDIEEKDTILSKVVKKIIGIKEENDALGGYFANNRVILGVDRLDYTKGLKLRLLALDRFFQRHKEYQGKAVYLGIIAPSREAIPSYASLKKELQELSSSINQRHEKKDWKPINLIFNVFSRRDIINFYRKASLCLVTPLDDGMNMVSKEFVLSSSLSQNPGMLVLSQFAGSAIDLTSSLIVNPYDIDNVVEAIKKGLEMKKEERTRRIRAMSQILDERNIYEWAKAFVSSAVDAKSKI